MTRNNTVYEGAIQSIAKRRVTRRDSNFNTQYKDAIEINVVSYDRSRYRYSSNFNASIDRDINTQAIFDQTINRDWYSNQSRPLISILREQVRRVTKRRANCVRKFRSIAIALREDQRRIAITRTILKDVVSYGDQYSSNHDRLIFIFEFQFEFQTDPVDEQVEVRSGRRASRGASQHEINTQAYTIDQ